MRNSSRILGSALNLFATHEPQLTARRGGASWLPYQVRGAQVCLIHSSSRRKTWRVDPPKPPSVHPQASRTVSLPLPDQVRGLMRLMTHSVVVCTSVLPAITPEYYADMEASLSDGEVFYHNTPVPRAMTMSSFTSLALSPVPVVTFNIALPSRTLEAVAASERFNIHILAGNGRGAAVADRFSKSNIQMGVRPVLESGDTCDVIWAGDENPPILSGDGILYVIRCRLLHDRGEMAEKRHRTEPLVWVKDHVIVLGEVMEILEGGIKGEKEKEEKFGLVYSDRKYRMLGSILNKDSD